MLQLNYDIVALVFLNLKNKNDTSVIIDGRVGFIDIAFFFVFISRITEKKMLSSTLFLGIAIIELSISQ